MRTARRTGKCPLTWDDAVAEAAADLGREGIWRMRASQDLRRVSMSVDEPNLVSHAGLVAVAELAQWLGVAERIDAHLDLSGTPGQANEGTKAMTVLGGLLAGADSIDDVAVLRTGALPQLFVIRASSTIGTFLRSFTFGHVRQLDAVARSCWGRRGPPARVRRRARTCSLTWTRRSARCTGSVSRARRSATRRCAATTRCWPPAPATPRAAAPGSCWAPGCAAETPRPAAARATASPRR